MSAPPVRQAAPRPEDFLPSLYDNLSDPYPLYRSYRDAGTLHRIAGTDAGREPEWLVFGYEPAASILADRTFGRRAAVAYAGSGPPPPLIPARFTNLGRLVDNWLVFMDPPRHTGLRTLIADQFAVRLKDRRLPDAVARIARELGAGLSGRAEIELVADFAAPLPMRVILETMGVPASDQGALREWALALQNGSSFRPGNRAERLSVAEQAAGELDAYFREQVTRRRRQHHDDLLGDLIRAELDGQSLTDDELVGTCSHLLTSGHEASTNAVCKGVLSLLRHPDALATLRDRPELMPAAVDELIRYDAPVQLVTRWAYADQEVDGYRIGRGDKVTVVLGAANRDPRRFAEPDTLRLDRGDRRHGGFGMGIHYCLGNALGRMQVGAGLSTVIGMLPELTVAGPVPYARDVVFHGPERLPLRRR